MDLDFELRPPQAPAGPLLAVEDLHVEFRTRDGVVNAVNGVSWEVHAGETFALLGESGSGKSVSAQAVMGILDTPPAYVTRGAVKFAGEDVLAMPEQRRRRLRGQRIAMVFQDALTALNPTFTVGWQIAEMLRIHRGSTRSEARRRAVELLDRVHIPAAADRLSDYPHEFSGGMRQRVMIAMALALDPAVLIADEPTTALDVTVQAQILELLADLQAEQQMALVLITHDLGVVAEVADRIAVMYAGRIVETAPAARLFRQPAHPYTEGLLASVPRVSSQGGPLEPIGGAPPNLARIPPGCAFHPRCGYRRPVCRAEEPPLYRVGPDRGSACHFYQEVLDDRG
ncbi:ABC transporter ATP-binding protein [Paractinoplanes rishiriensis]|uniref:ABC transporter ATP-binding protein n=1 Tax=Paractinoplanes rishiriensis TaxID=1050105 RepID=A0A919N2P6_9ACTN|nr:ABC transporter ATP-binding protein [Actinoplanes rishiriensis]GIF01228.1 ABC transporter ATP-binding protein [Actinoplanes rishiriensis]